MIRSEIRARILHGLNEPDVANPVFWSATELNQVIDEAMEVLAEETAAIKRTTYVPLEAAWTYYSLRGLAPDLMVPWRLWVVSQERRLTPVTMEELDRFHREWITVTGDPWHWFPLSWETFGLFPKPASAGGVLRVDYLAWPRALLDDDDEPEMDLADHEALVGYGIYDGLAKRWDQLRMVEAWALFQRQGLGAKGRAGARAQARSAQRGEVQDFEEPGIADR
ncbi:MAG: hypothetical protein HY323_09195 [Betaproteobacteria bacterium]|nr:hypothetical protein [Betaproteobacteria bacterium]